MLFQDPTEDQFIVVINDIDSDDFEIHGADSEDHAIAFARATYDNAPSPGQPEGNTYSPNEVPNARIFIAKIVKVSVI